MFFTLKIKGFAKNGEAKKVLASAKQVELVKTEEQKFCSWETFAWISIICSSVLFTELVYDVMSYYMLSVKYPGSYYHDYREDRGELN